MLFSSLFALSLVAHAEGGEEPKFPVVKPSGVTFVRYQYDLTDGMDGANAFSLDRVYLRTDVDINKRFGARVTLDADRMKPATLGSGESVTYDTKYRLFVKHAYLEVRELGPVKIRAGMVETPMAPFYDNFWGKRYIAESFVKNAGLASTADLGVQVVGNHAKGLFSWNAELVNGEGYDKPEVDAGKSLQARVTVDPLAKTDNKRLPVSGFVSYSGHPSTETQTLVWDGSVGFSMPRFIGWAEVAGKSEADVSGFGYSVTLNPRMPKYAGLLARYDHWDPDTSTDDDATNILIGGVEKDFLEKVSLAITYERTWADATPDTPIHGVVAHMQAGF